MRERVKTTVKCDRDSCFRNNGGLCTLLEEPFMTKPCPFYKSNGRVSTEQFALSVGQISLYLDAARIDREEAR
jgi:hypothetical protein